MQLPLLEKPKISSRKSIGCIALLVVFLLWLVYLTRVHVYVFSGTTGPIVVWNDQEAHVFLERETQFIVVRPLKVITTALAGFFAPPVPHGNLRRDLYIARLTPTGVDIDRRFRDVDYTLIGGLKRGPSFDSTYTFPDEDEWQPYWFNGTEMQPYTRQEVAEMKADFDTPAYLEIGDRYYGWETAGYGRHPFENQPDDGETTSIAMGNIVYKLRFEATKHKVSSFSYHEGKGLTIYVSGGGLKDEQVLLSVPAEIRKVTPEEIPDIAGAIARELGEDDEKALGVRIEQRHRPLQRWTAKPLQEF